MNNNPSYINQLIDLAKDYLRKKKSPWEILVSHVMRTILLIITLSVGTTLIVSANGKIFGWDVGLSYENTPDIAIPLISAASLVLLLFFTYIHLIHPKKPKSDLIAEFDKKFEEFRCTESMCEKSKEIYGVNITPNELREMKEKASGSLKFVTIIEWLRKARPHISHDQNKGFVLISPYFPYKIVIFLFNIISVLGMSTAIVATIYAFLFLLNSGFGPALQVGIASATQYVVWYSAKLAVDSCNCALKLANLTRLT